MAFLPKRTLAQQKSLRPATRASLVRVALTPAPDDKPPDKLDHLLSRNSDFEAVFKRRRMKKCSPRDCQDVLARHMVASDLDFSDNEIAASLRHFCDMHFSDLKNLGQYERAIPEIIRSVRARNERGQAVEAVNLIDRGASKADKLEILSNAIGVSIHGITRFDSDPPTYSLQLATRKERVFIGEGPSLIEQRKFAGVLFDYANYVMPRFKPTEWHEFVTCMAGCIEDSEAPPEATHLGAVREWLRHYLEVYIHPQRVDEAQRWALAKNMPGILNDAVWFSMNHFRRFIQISFNDRPTVNELAARLPGIGCEFEQRKTFRTEEGFVCRSLWRAPEELCPTLSESPVSA